MKRKYTYRIARNRESKDRNLSVSRVKECRHMWADGICLKCGVKQEDLRLEQARMNKGGPNEKKNH